MDESDTPSCHSSDPPGTYVQLKAFPYVTHTVPAVLGLHSSGLSSLPHWQGVPPPTFFLLFSCQAYKISSITKSIHIQIPPSGYVGLILCSTDVATVSRSTVGGTMRVLYSCSPRRVSRNYALCIKWCLLCSSNMSVTHSALAFTCANRTDARAKH